MAWTPNRRKDDSYGEYSIAFMWQMIEKGVDEAIKCELANPTCGEAGWCRMVVDLAAKRSDRQARKAQVGDGAPA